MSDIIDIYSEYNRRGRRGVLPFGTGQAFDDVADLEPGAVVIDFDDGGVLKQKVQFFKNEGSDWVNCGRPSNIINALAPNQAFEVEVKFSCQGGFGGVFSLGSNESTDNQVLIWIDFGASRYVIRVGGTVSYVSEPNLTAIHKVKIISDGVTTDTYVDDIYKTTLTNGGYISPSNLILCAGQASQFFNPEMEVFYIAIKDGDGNLVDAFDFTSPAKFDGVTAISDNGIVGIVTDGTPVSTLSYDLIPLEYL